MRLLKLGLMFVISSSTAIPGLDSASADAMVDRSSTVSDAQMTKRQNDIAEARRMRGRVGVDEFDHREWSNVRPIQITRYWSGEQAPSDRHAEARILWDSDGVSFRFTYLQKEPAVVSSAPRLDKKTLGLWERDVCEVFIAPDPKRPERYYEFETAPTAEWVDLAILWKPDGRETDWDFRSKMKAATRVVGERVTIVMRVPWSALGRAPHPGERWRANFFRCVGREPSRGYLTWRPTSTPEPSFHVPQAFGELEFKG